MAAFKGMAVSNIGWTAEEDVAVAELLARRGIQAIEVAPARLFAEPASATSREIRETRAFWNDRGLRIVSMQALLFGRPDLIVFGNAEQQRAFADYMTRIIALAALLGCGPLVFGSPKARLRGELPFDAACERAAALFRPLAAVAAAHGCTLCFEPNATGYGCDFVTRFGEAVRLARLVDHPGFKVQLDSGNFAMEDDRLEDVRDGHAEVGHFHASAPQLAPLTEEGPLEALLEAVAGRYEGFITLEMRKQNGGSNLESLGRSLDRLQAAIGRTA